ncbi:GDP-mannose transporter GONST2 [Acorus calamus]|uniref:GDP-mannose transporter GONST2 n=1 Tax=Acorus calamus TaxID=4465 RepID=A0AAV9FAP0_ACOCL|nr:GDP-mannose transporter GONST2 [Acorus calamus]
MDILDKRISCLFKDEMMQVLGIAMRCTCTVPSLRPAMNEVVQLLMELDLCKLKSCKELNKFNESLPATEADDPNDRGTFVHDVSLPTGQTVKPHKILEIRFGPLLSGIAYCISSCGMILLNKVVLSSYNFNAGISLMLYQIISAVSGGITDLSFDAVGYAWQSMNCILTASYSLGGFIEQDTDIHSRHTVVQSPNQHTKPLQHTFWSICWGIFRKGEDELAVV